ncbi:MAG: imidazole glycerol phosphate synthase subunit HisH [Alphaproteobacteria bacterium]|nr:imidazole glycerol phosphate synthase subunit HisH [Alphaproteobacteria bacterium]
MIVGLVDIGIGNLGSVENALMRCRLQEVSVRQITDPDHIRDVDAFVLPGVGAFAPAMKKLHRSGLGAALTEKVLGEGAPFLGICVGMQLIAAHSEEGTGSDGLGWLKGRWIRLKAEKGFPVPHVGWNTVHPVRQSPLFDDIQDNTHFYFDHSFTYIEDRETVVAETGYGGATIVSGLQQNNIFAVQFHPERSQRSGARMLENFVSIAAQRYRKSSGNHSWV